MKLDEGIHDALRAIYDEFDHHTKMSNTKWGVELDEPNEQSFRVTDCRDPMGLLHHIANYIKDYPVALEVNGLPIHFQDLSSSRFEIPPRKGGTIYKFMVKPIQELDEDTLKFPSNKHGREQSEWRSSYRRHQTRDTYEGNSEKKGKNMREFKDFGSRLEESVMSAINTSGNSLRPALKMEQPFNDVSEITEEPKKDKKAIQLENRIMEGLDQHMAFTEPDKLITIAPQAQSSPINLNSVLINAKTMQEDFLKNYLQLLEESDEDSSPYLEELIENCTTQINLITSMLERNNGTDSA